MSGIEELQRYVDTLIVIPNQNLFRMANERTTFEEAFKMADQVLYMGVRGVTDLMMAPGLVNLDFADIRTVMAEMGKAMMGTGEAEGENRAIRAAEAAISNPLLEDTSMRGARGLLINITGGDDMTLFEVDQAANRIREEVDEEANIIFGSAVEEDLNGPHARLGRRHRHRCRCSQQVARPGAEAGRPTRAEPAQPACHAPRHRQARADARPAAAVHRAGAARAARRHAAACARPRRRAAARRWRPGRCRSASRPAGSWSADRTRSPRRRCREPAPAPRPVPAQRRPATLAGQPAPQAAAPRAADGRRLPQPVPQCHRQRPPRRRSPPQPVPAPAPGGLRPTQPVAPRPPARAAARTIWARHPDLPPPPDQLIAAGASWCGRRGRARRAAFRIRRSAMRPKPCLHRTNSHNFQCLAA